MDERTKIFKQLLPSNCQKLLLKDIVDEDEITYTRTEIHKDTFQKKLRDPNSKAAKRKSDWRNKTKIVNGEVKTNREIEREYEKVNKALLRNRKRGELAKKQDALPSSSPKAGKKKKEERPVFLPDVNALTGFSRPSETVGEYCRRRRLKIDIEEIFEASVRPHPTSPPKVNENADIISLDSKGKLQRETIL